MSKQSLVLQNSCQQLVLHGEGLKSYINLESSERFGNVDSFPIEIFSQILGPGGERIAVIFPRGSNHHLFIQDNHSATINECFIPVSIVIMNGTLNLNNVNHALILAPIKVSMLSNTTLNITHNDHLYSFTNSLPANHYQPLANNLARLVNNSVDFGNAAQFMNT